LTEAHKICDVQHPDYITMRTVWRQWRLTYKGGRWFIDHYLKRLSRRETADEFRERKEMTYCPAFAKSAIIEVRNAIFQRLVDVTRTGGPETYRKAVLGELGGVDLFGSTMTSFIGRKVLHELLSMARVGIYVDAPRDMGVTLKEKGSRHPYLYTYWAEDIRSWCRDETSNDREFKSVVLRDHPHKLDPNTGLPLNDVSTRFRHYWINEDDGFVWCQFFDENGDLDIENPEAVRLDIKKIPFVMLELDNSLLTDASDYQVALLNMASSDVTYAVKSNIPIYTEQSDPRHSSKHLRRRPQGVKPPRDLLNGNIDHSSGDNVGEAGTAQKANAREINVGAGTGRSYAPGMDRPGYINPSPEPLQVSMLKQKQMKAEIRQLIHLAVTNLEVKMASAASKGMDNHGLEAGLSAIGLELEVAERKIGEYWALYEGSKTAPTITYPKNYSLKTEADRFEEAKHLKDEQDAVPSNTYKKLISKRIATILVGHHATNEELKRIHEEIDAAVGTTADPDIISQDVERGLVSAATASLLRGYEVGEAAKAAAEHAERLAKIAAFQAKGGGANQARGIADAGDGDESQREKAAAQQTETDDVVTNKTRGEAK